MLAATLVFSVQDGISQHLSREYNVYMVVMVRYWFFAAFVIALAARQPGGIKATAGTTQLFLQCFRGVLLVVETCIAMVGFVILGLVQSHAVFASFPLIVAALSGPILGEQVGWRRWLAIGIGFLGMVVILQPGSGVFHPAAAIPLLAALLFSVYSLLTRYAARKDNAATSFFWTGVAGAVGMTIIGLPNLEMMSAPDWGWMFILCVLGVTGHWFLIKCYEVAEAGAVQPFAYFHLVFASVIGMVVFGEILQTNVALGAGIIVVAGLFTLWREQMALRRGKRA